MPIDQETDETFREQIEYAVHNRIDDLARIIAKAGETGQEKILPLTIQAVAYIAIDASERWPNDADLKDTAHIASESGTGLSVTEDEMYQFLSRSVFGSETVLSVFKDNDNAPVIPLFTLANLLVSFKPPQGKGWNAWLDVIEAAIETAEKVAPLAAPAVAYLHLKK